MTTTTDRPASKKISQRDPEADMDVIRFYINGDSTTTPAVEYEVTGEGITVTTTDGETWHDSGSVNAEGITICLVLSDEPDGYMTHVLMEDTICSDWALGEAVRTLTEIQRRRAAMRASGHKR